MPRIICTLPNASSLINGVTFIGHKLGAISEDIEQDVADAFLAIDGFVAQAEVVAKAIATATPKAATAAATRATRAAEAVAAPDAATAEKQADTGAPDLTAVATA